MEKFYTIWDRISHEGKEISVIEAENISKSALMHTGPYGYMGYQIDKVLYEEFGDKEENCIMAVHYNGEWLVIPENQNTFMDFELSHHMFKED